ncbi:MAG: nitrilase-related carbon-nitrogen hydrolase [Planctomycetota bacterium]
MRPVGTSVGPGVRIALVCVGAALGLLSTPPGPLPPLILAADVPFLALLFLDGGRRWKRWAWLYGMAHYALLLRWLGEVHVAEVPAAAFVLGPIYVLLGLAIRTLARWRVPFVAGVGVAVVFEEMLRTVWMGGMPWPLRSLAFASEVPAGQALTGLVPAAGLVGAYAFSFVAGSTSALLYGAARLARFEGADRRRAARSVLVSALVPVAALFVLALAARTARQDHDARRASGEAFVSDADFLAVQANIPQDLKNAGGPTSNELLDRHLAVSAEALAAVGDKPVAGLLWPETMVPWPWLAPGLEARYPPAWRDEVSVVRRVQTDVTGKRDIDVFLGVLSRHPHPDGHARGVLGELPERDSLVHVRPRRVPPPTEPLPRPPLGDARPPWSGPVERHDKVNLVPGGEYTPLGGMLPFLKKVRDLVAAIPELQPGEADQPPFRLEVGPPWIEGPEPAGHKVLHVGSVICFDLAFPATCRGWRERGADVLLNPANYGWFGQSDFRAQVLALARLRAAETRTSIVMAGNTGPTVFVDPVGRLYGRFVTRGGDPQGQPAGGVATTFTEGWASGPLVADPALTPYVRMGDLVWFAAALLLLGIGGWRRRVRR